MSDELTPRLNLPLIGDHAQKKLVMNEALMRLESLVQASVLSRSVTAQPAMPADGDSYILPDAATGTEWGALPVGAFVRADGGMWEVMPFPEGALVHVADENRFVVRGGGGWVTLESLLLALDNLTRLGIGAAADSTNVLTVRGAAALLSAKYAAEGGSGDISLALNREGDADSAQILLQQDYGTRAIVGLLGDGDLSVKVSPDGSVFTTALRLDAATGALNLLSGSAAAPALAVGASGTGFYSSAVAALDGALSGARRLALWESGNLVSLRVGDIDTTLNPASAFVMRRSGNASAGAAVAAVSDNAGNAALSSQCWGSTTPTLSGLRGRGTQAAPAYPNSGDTVLNLAGLVSTAAMNGSTNIAELTFSVQAASPSAADLQSRAVMSLVPAGSAARSEILRIEHATGLSMYGANPVIDHNRNLRRRIYTVATLPPASPAGQSAMVSDASSPAFAAIVSGGGSLHAPVYSDGSDWRCG